MSDSIQYFVSQHNLQTRLFNNVVSGVNDADAATPLNVTTNHIAWLTGHIVSTRFMLATVLGIEAQEPYPALFANGKGMDADATYPSMADLTKDWNGISEQIAAAIGGLNADALAQEMPRPVPTGNTLGDFIVFLMHHEAYTIGQIGISRRFHGLEAMNYS